MRMHRETFLMILRAIEADITPKNNIGGNEPLSAEEQLSIAIHIFGNR